MMRKNSGTTELTSMSSSSQHLQEEEQRRGGKNKQKKKKKKSKSTKKSAEEEGEEEDKGGSSSGYSSEPESPLGTDSSFSLSTPNANSSQENIAHMRMLEKKSKETATTTSISTATTPTKKKTKSAVEEIAQMITKNAAFNSDDDDDVSERRRKQHERDKSSTRFPSTEKLIVLPPNLTSSTSPVHRPSSPSLGRARRESDDSGKINALRRQLSSASRQQQQFTTTTTTKRPSRAHAFLRTHFLGRFTLSARSMGAFCEQIRRVGVFLHRRVLEIFRRIFEHHFELVPGRHE